jgi:hypothetical protein
MYIFWIASLAIYFIDPFFADSKFLNVYKISTILLSTFLIFLWLMYDARENQIFPSGSLKLSVIVLGIIAVPYYIFRYKGLKRGFVSLAKFVGFLIGAILITVVAGELGV